MNVQLTGERILLSPPEASDIDLIARRCQDPDVLEWTTMPRPYRQQDAEQFVLEVTPEGWATGTSLTWAIRAGEPVELVGMIGLHHIEAKAAEIGFWLAPEARGNGLVSEAVALVCEYAFAADGAGLARIEWYAFVGNTASASVARRAGFRFEGMRRLGGVQRGVRRDEWSASLLATDARGQTGGWPAETFAR